MPLVDHDRRITLLFGAAILVLAVAPFLGKQIIPLGHVLVGIAFLSSCFAQGGIAGSRKRLRPSWWLLSAFVVWAALSVLANLDRLGETVLDHLSGLRYPIAALLLVAMPHGARLLGDSRRFRDVLLWSVIGAISLSVLFGLASIHLGLPLSENKEIARGRLSNLDGEIIAYATALAYAGLLLGALLAAPEVRGRFCSLKPVWIAAATVFALVGLYLTLTRGAMIGFAAGLFLLCARFSRKLLYTVAAVGVALVVLAFATDSRYLRLEDPMRTSHWLTASLAAARHPIVGLGYENYSHHSLELKKEFGTLPPDDFMKKGEKWGKKEFGRGHAHNNFLQAFATTGIPGGLLFLGFCWSWLREAWASPTCRRIFLPAIVAFLVSGMFDASFFNGETASAALLLYFGTQALLHREGDA